MPELIASYLIPLLVQAGAVGAFGFSGTAAIALGLSYLLLAGAAYLVASAFQQAKPEAPKPEDGKYSLKQSVPPLVYVLGRVKKGGDYAFLEERDAVAYHIIVHAAHHIRGYVEHWFHDQTAPINSGGYVIGLFAGRVRLLSRLGDDASTAYENLLATFPEIYTADHRGDGLASTCMAVGSESADLLQQTYPNGMPNYVPVIQGHDRLIDPRTGLPGYSENLAVFRYWHLTHPVGGKLNRGDLYAPDWARAAEVCDQVVTNRTGQSEPRYHGGMWFRANNDPVQVGRLMDQAAEMVIYERADGKVGVHPGEWVEPDVRLTANDIISLSYDPNKRKASTVLAVRGRYTDPDKGYNTVDAAIYGVPYPSEDERTKTVDNQTVQRHNHIARLEKLAYIRANAPRVKIKALYEPARQVPYRRFITVHLPPKMTEAAVEIIGRPVLSLRNMTYEFEGIIVPRGALYLFNAPTEEGAPGSNVIPVERKDVPVPEGFDVTIGVETVGGADAFFGLATWNPITGGDLFTYELEWQPTAGGAVQSVTSVAGVTELRSNYIADDIEVKFRLRRWSADTPSAWTTYKILTP